MDEKYIVGSYKGHNVYFDRILYYVVIDGRFFTIDEKKIHIKE